MIIYGLRILCAIVMLAVVVMGYGTLHLFERVQQLDANQQETTARVTEAEASLVQLKQENDSHNSSLGTLDQRMQEQNSSMRAYEQQLQDLRTPPGPDQVAAEIMAANEAKLVETIAKLLSEEPRFSAALRGKPGEDADPKEVADIILSDMLSTPLAEMVAVELWAKRQEEIVSQPQLIASVAAEVYETFGEELRKGIRAGITAEKIAEFLSDSPRFAELVAFMSVQSSAE